jgi:APA family basic amino acid/polyamine antiporter
MSPANPHLGLATGIGLVIANMIGAGVFLSAGFMAQDLGPGQILLAWVVGTAVALCGTRAYAALSLVVARSGGEYRCLHDLLHPLLGYFAGWVTLFMGFSAPVAVNALAAAAFTGTLVPVGQPRVLASVYVLVLTVLHARDLQVSRWTQDLLVLVKIALVGAFALLGVLAGNSAWPTWTPPHASDSFPTQAFAVSLFFIAFAFSGWNAAIYSMEEFRNPRRDVPRAMLVGCAVVAALYLVVNWVFVANLTPQRAAVVFEYETARVTLGHLIAQDLLGPVGGRAMSVLAVCSFLSAMSAMIFVGPRVYAAMAGDGLLPAILKARAGRPPAGSVWFQGAVTLLLLQAQTLRDILANVGAILTLVVALTVLALIKVWLAPGARPRPDGLSVLCAVVYIAVAAWLLPHGLRDRAHLALWLGGLASATVIAYGLTRMWQRTRPASTT